MPPGIPYIVGNEAAERFSFYGMKAILTIFMTQHLVSASGESATFSDEEAKGIFHLFTAAAYVFPVVGALLSDILWGKYRTILYLSLGYCVGHAALALGDTELGRGLMEPRAWLYAGLILIAVGAGGIKPCVSAHLGDQFGTKNQRLIPRAFSWFYFSVNVGATVSFLLTPVLLEHLGPSVAFGVPGVLMAIALLVFWLGRHRFAHVPAAGARRFAREIVGPDGLRALMNLAVVYLLIAPFWALFDQTGSSWVLQAEAMDRHFLGVEWLSSQIGAVNPVLVLLLIPLFSYVIYPWANRHVAVTALGKIAVGMFLASLAFVITAWVQMGIDAGEKPNIGWQLVAYLVLTCAEILVSITALEFSYTQAPRRMKSIIMAAYMASVFLGNAFTSAVNFLIATPDGPGRLQGSSYFWFFAGIMFVSAALFLPTMRLYKGQTFIQGEEGSRPA